MEFGHIFGLTSSNIRLGNVSFVNIGEKNFFIKYTRYFYYFSVFFPNFIICFKNSLETILYFFSENIVNLGIHSIQFWKFFLLNDAPRSIFQKLGMEFLLNPFAAFCYILVTKRFKIPFLQCCAEPFLPKNFPNV